MLDKLFFAQACFDSVMSIIKELVDPNTPDNRIKCQSDLTSFFVRLGDSPEESAKDAKYITDTVAAMAGAQDAVDPVVEDVKKEMAAKGKTLDPHFEDYLRTALTKAEEAIQEWRSGKPIQGGSG
jgi:hypothetical protein